MKPEVEIPKFVSLTASGLALCDFAFRDGPALGLDAMDAYETAKRLIKQWDGTETLAQIYQRTILWPDEFELVEERKD